MTPTANPLTSTLTSNISPGNTTVFRLDCVVISDWITPFFLTDEVERERRRWELGRLTGHRSRGRRRQARRELSAMDEPRD